MTSKNILVLSFETQLAFGSGVLFVCWVHRNLLQGHQPHNVRCCKHDDDLDPDVWVGFWLWQALRAAS